MLRLLYNCKSLTPIKIASNSPTHICSAFWKSKSFSSSGSDFTSSSSITISKEQQFSSTVRDLINSHGLSGPTPPKSSAKADSVRKLFRNYGFSETQIKTIVSKTPRILKFGPEENLKPKIDFFRSIGISEADVANMITAAPYLLYRSLKTDLIPSFDLLKSSLGTEQNAVYLINRYPVVLDYGIRKNLEPNLSTLRDIGVPNFRISKMIRSSYMLTLVRTASDWFSKVVHEVMKMGFDPCSSSFASAIAVMAVHHKESSWAGKLRFFGSFGFSDQEMLSMFRKQPFSMSLSEEKSGRAVEFFLDKFRWSPSQLSGRPNVLTYSLEKRIIPRCSVLQLLALRDRNHKSVSVITILRMNEKDFVGRYLNRYKDEVPEVLDAYDGKLKFDEYTFDSGGPKGAMAL